MSKLSASADVMVKIVETMRAMPMSALPPRAASASPAMPLAYFLV
jgi:hypothetical protein